MALRKATLRTTAEKMASAFDLRRWTHAAAAQSPPLSSLIPQAAASTRLVLPEFSCENNHEDTGFRFPSFPVGGGSMELMAVPKRKTSPHKRGIRNGPKALKPIPVIVRCKGCGRVKLPHFFCCSGDRGNTPEQNGSST